MLLWRLNPSAALLLTALRLGSEAVPGLLLRSRQGVPTCGSKVPAWNIYLR